MLCKQCLFDLSIRKIADFVITCTSCKKTHRLAQLDDAPVSKATIYLVKQCHQDESTAPASIDQIDDNSKSNQPFQNMMQQLDKDLKLARFNIQIHYDDAINNIDIRTETLINSLNQARTQMQEKINELRKKSVDEFNNEFENLKLNDLDMQPSKLIPRINKIEHRLASINQNLSYFSDNTLQPFDKSLIGHILCKEIDTNFLKIKDLKSILNDQSPEKTQRVTLKFEDNINDNVVRQNVIPLSLQRILKVYFFNRRSVYLELYDAEGKLVNKLNAFENLSSFPISYGYGNYFVISFTSKSYNATPYETNPTHVLLYDTNFKLIKAAKMLSSVESAYMNEKYICLFYAHRSNACCTLFDYELNQLASFGQQVDPDKPFYMEKITLSWKEQVALSLKNNPRIFGITNDNIYFYSLNKMTIMCRHTGVVKKELPVSGDTPNFLLDNQSNIIQVHSVSKRISITNYEHEYSIHNTFDDNLEDVFITAENNLVFVDKNKDKVLFI
jgi:hypothetical protein